jgi:tRNA(Ile)-lysidine synthase
VTNLLEHVERSVRERGLLKERERVVVAVSGGLDSTVLLHLLHELAAAYRWKLSVAHLNHQLRGRSSAGDERFVRTLAEKLGLPCFVERADVRGFAKLHQLSLEMAARRLRHEFLARCAGRFKARTVAVAHHADDQVELFFLRLLRGAGGVGMQGMKWHSPSPARVWSSAFRRSDQTTPFRLKAGLRTVERQTDLVRPLLDVPRAELQQFAVERKLAFREDASNTSVDILRNRIRHRLLPLLQREFQPAIARTVTRLMDIIGAEAAFARAAAESWLGRKRRPSFKTLPTAVQRTAVRLQLLERGIVPDFDLAESLVDVPNRAVSIGMDVAVWRNESGLVHVAETKPLRFSPRSHVLKLKGRAGECVFGDLHFQWKLARKRGASLSRRIAAREFFDADRVGAAVTLRHWQPGDRFQPIGLAQPAKLQDLLTNARIAPARRRELALAATADGGIFWVEGLRIGEAFKLTGATIRRLQWRWRRR